MNSQQRIRLYLEKHHVGAMFEELMTKLVTEMPCDPVAFLVRLLQQKMASGNAQTVMSVSHLRNGVGDLTSALEIARLRVHSKPLSASAASKPRPASFKCSQQSPHHRKEVTVFFPEERFQTRSAPLKPIRYNDRAEATKRVARPPKTPTFPSIAKVGSPKASRHAKAEDFQENLVRLRDFELVDLLSDETVFSSPPNAAKLEKCGILPNFVGPRQKTDVREIETWKSRSFARSPESIVEMYEDPCVMAEEGVSRVNCGRGLRVSGRSKKDDVGVCLRCAEIMKLGNDAQGDCSDNDDKIDSASQVNVAKMPNWTDDSGASTEGGTANSSPRNAVVRRPKLLATPAAKQPKSLTQTDELFSSSFHRFAVSPRRRAPDSRSPNLFLREASDDDDELYAWKSGERPTPTVRVWEVFSDTDCRS